MRYYNPDGGVVIKSWCNNPEEGCIKQAENLARLPFVFKQVCLMPDTHQGYGMPIGGVLATKGVIIPNAVGVDIGCGMCAVRTSLTDLDRETLTKIMGGIREVVPVGFAHQKEAQDESLMPKENMSLQCQIIIQEYGSALKQLGTLGGGNHFIEIQRGNDGFVWIMIHSGSRNLGLKSAKFFNEEAVRINERYFSRVPKEWELAFLPTDSDVGDEYENAMYYCVDFAYANRKLMMDNISKVFSSVASGVLFGEMINIAHNYATQENHFGENVWVHRKGATLAREGTIGIIPGSQGTKSYIVRGKGNPESFMSCSHGAGRKMGRKEAQRTLDLETEKAALDAKGIVHSVRNVKDLDEAPGSYKDIDVVMKEQEDLVDILVELTPMGVIKG